jgi:phosphocarrier protein HPr
MSEVKSSRDVVVTNSQGLHARPANLIMKLAAQFESKIELVKGNERIDGKSILEILTLGAAPGTSISIEAIGPDSAAAVDALARLFAGNFDEDQQDNTQDS